ncbi:Melanoma-associated antigen G1 [Sorochytrium milnesiophthora]
MDGDSDNDAAGVPARPNTTAEVKQIARLMLFKELDRTHIKKSDIREKGAHPATSGQYILANRLRLSEQQRELIDWKHDRPLIGILGIILVVIFVQGGKVSDDDLYTYIRRFKLLRDEPHPVLGLTFDQTLTRLEKQGYLYRAKAAAADAAAAQEEGAKHPHVNMWGPRATVEFPKDQLVAFVTSVYGDKATDNLRNEILQSNAL